MKNLGIISVLAGIVMMLVFSTLAIVSDGGMPALVLYGMALLSGGILLILVVQIKERRKEKEEEHDYRQY
ncbi:MAG: hypothetical protein AVO33_00735 [delta proteobacterium ML8_F1]|nr:MAG: hypothetical protein AVO33_00735 [delta proteobacterium ML8_F1]